MIGSRRSCGSRLTALVLALSLPAATVVAQSAGTVGEGRATPVRFSLPLSLQIGLPQGEFGSNVDVAGGFGIGLLWGMGDLVGLRADLGAMIYGSETQRVPLGGGALGLIEVDVTTTNSIFQGGVGLQVGLPGRGITPYAGGMLGFSNFSTTSSVEGSNSAAEPFATSTNLDDNAFAKTLFGGLYIPFGKGNAMFDLGVRYTLNGERVRYLTEGDISEDLSGAPVLNFRETRADIFILSIGVSLPLGSSRR